MSSWQQSLLNKLALNESLCYTIHDPDQLCLEPFIQQHIQSSPAVIVRFEDPVALRLSYEQWRQRRPGAFLLVYNKNDEEQSLPWDIQQAGKALDFHISHFISEVDVSVLRSLPSHFYNDIRRTLDTYRPGEMSEQASLSFVLRHIFKIAPEIIQTDVDLVRLLIRKHYLSMEMPAVIEDFLVTTLRFNSAFANWPLPLLVQDKGAFFELLQAQWSVYLRSLADGTRNDLIVPFDDQDIRVFINDLFAEGYLTPVEFEQLPAGHWASIGIVSNHQNPLLKQYRHLFEVISKRFTQLREGASRAMEWGGIASDFGRLMSLSYELASELTDEQFIDLHQLESELEQSFSQWAQESYSSLLNEPTVKYPPILHKVAPWLQQKVVANNRRVCLLVMDGMGFQQWAVIRKHIQGSGALRLEEGHCFAWVPTITSISRQALFAGKAPYYFARDVLNTTNEGKHWQAFWKNEGLSEREIGYQKTLERIDQTGFEKLITNRRLKVLGAVINFIDDQMHGIVETGMAGLNGQVATWVQQWNFASKLEAMVNAGFDVVITADHGGQACKGSGRISDGVSAETKGERVRIYTHQSLREKAAADYPEPVIEWPPSRSALPDNLYPMLSLANAAFVQKGSAVVGHGGISLHEVIVPLALVSASSCEDRAIV